MKFSEQYEQIILNEEVKGSLTADGAGSKNLPFSVYPNEKKFWEKIEPIKASDPKHPNNSKDWQILRSHKDAIKNGAVFIGIQEDEYVWQDKNGFITSKV